MYDLLFPKKQGDPTMNDNIRFRSLFVIVLAVCSSLYTWFVVEQMVSPTRLSDWAVLGVIASACFFFKEYFHNKKQHELGMIVAALCASAAVAVLFELRSMNALYLAIIVISGIALYNGSLTGNPRNLPSFKKPAKDWNQMAVEDAQVLTDDNNTISIMQGM
jgi:hypothetical protein